MIQDRLARMWEIGDRLILSPCRGGTYDFDMTEISTNTEVMPPPKKPWVVHAIWAAIILVPLAFVTILLLMSGPAEGQCSGIGWGCELAGSDAALFFLIIVGIPLAFIWLIGHGIIAFVQSRKRKKLAAANAA
jgi:hypothetical protein